MDRIAYHPIRVSPPTSLFLPYTEQELKTYQDRSANPLFIRPESSNTYRPPHLRNALNRSPQTLNSSLQPARARRQDTASVSQPSARVPPPVSKTNHPINNSSQERVIHRPGLPVRQTEPVIQAVHPISQHSSLPPHPSLPPTPAQHPQAESRQQRSQPVVEHDDVAANEQPNATHRSPPYYSNASPLIIVGSPHSYPRDKALWDGNQSISDAVAEHYNARPNQGKDARIVSPIFGLRKFNNWIKSVIIGKFASRDSMMIKSIPNRNSYKGTKVLELGCGKGGDLAKWQKAGVEQLYGFDIAKVSIEQAQQRYHDTSRHKFYAKMVALDCFSVDITTVLSPDELSRPFDAVSLQFCMHYAFETEQKARMMLQNVSNHLIKGGVFIGTIPDPDKLLYRLDAMAGERNIWGNPVYEVRFPALQPRPRYGFKYMFYLKDAVENVPEYVVFWEPFVELAAEYGLELVFKEGFHAIFENERHTPQHRQLLNRMEVTNSDGQCLMSADQWEAAGIYLAFAFVKK